MQQLDQATYYSRRRDEHQSFAARARSVDAVGFQNDLAERYARLCSEAAVFGQEYGRGH